MRSPTPAPPPSTTHDLFNVPDPTPHNDSPREELMAIFAEFFDGFGFKPNLGRIWAALFYNEAPMSQREICAELGLSSGLVSQGLAELMRFGMVDTEPAQRGRETLYHSETSLLKIVSSILKQREEQIIQRLEERIRALQSRLAIQTDLPQQDKKRLERLEEILVICQLASSIIGLVEMFSRYSYHAVALGARALTHLRVAQLPDLLGLTKRTR
ncbi:hypothetical protein L6R29_03680 [Myxococcota bacterium]|nr:hypothetical protein [Myxococcota bacterium]